jgi:hypothetical protein
MDGRYLIAVAVIIVIIVYYLATLNVDTYEQYMYGLWTADDDFCADACISSMLLFIGEPCSGWTSVTRPCYLIIADNITSQLFDMQYRTGWGGMVVGTYTVTATVKFENSDAFGVGDKPVEFVFDMPRGVLTIRDDDRIYGKLYKQNDISNLLAVGEQEVPAIAAESAGTQTQNKD